MEGGEKKSRTLLAAWMIEIMARAMEAHAGDGCAERERCRRGVAVANGMRAKCTGGFCRHLGLVDISTKAIGWSGLVVGTTERAKRSLALRGCSLRIGMSGADLCLQPTSHRQCAQSPGLTTRST